MIIEDLGTITFNFDLKNGTVNFKINDIIKEKKNNSSVGSTQVTN